jgi:hypothetical protein
MIMMLFISNDTPNKSPEPPLALSVPLSRFTPLVGGGSAFYATFMRHRFLGFICTLAALVFVYIAAWVSGLGGFGGVMSDDSYPFSIFLLPIIATIFSAFILFVVVLPQALFARFVVRRFTDHRIVPFLIFLVVSSLLIVPIARWHSIGSPLWTLAWGLGYLLSGCSVLWCISFRHDRV